MQKNNDDILHLLANPFYHKKKVFLSSIQLMINFFY